MIHQQHDTLVRLTRTLEEYLAAVPRQREPNPPDLLDIYTRLDLLESKLDSSCPAQLRHYLHQKSYRKAHLFLQGQEAQNLRGSCGQ